MNQVVADDDDYDEGVTVSDKGSSSSSNYNYSEDTGDPIDEDQYYENSIDDTDRLKDDKPGWIMRYEVSSDLGEYWDQYHGMVMTPAAKLAR